MSWTTPMTAVASSTLTAAQWNTHVRDNFLETFPAKATTAGQYAVATGGNAIAVRRVGSSSALATATTTSTTYISSSGPTVTLDCGPEVLVFLYGQMTINTNSESAFLACEISGANTVAGSDARALTVGRYSSQFLIGGATVTHYTALTPGSNTFTGVIRVTNAAATGTFDNRRLMVMSF
jgi:hypothetical protein